MVAAAAAGFCCIAPDLPGYGLSDPPIDLAKASWEGLMNDLLEILDSLSISKVSTYRGKGKRYSLRSIIIWREVCTKSASINMKWREYHIFVDHQHERYTCKLVQIPICKYLSIAYDYYTDHTKQIM